MSKTSKAFTVLFLVLALSILTYLYFSGLLTDLIKPKQEILTLTLEQNGSTIKIKNGDTVKLGLEGNITTGYSWEMDSLDQSYLVQVGEMEYGGKPNPRRLSGAPGIFNYTFKAVNEGQTKLKMKYHRTFEKDVEPIDTFTLNIEISN